MEFVVKTVNLLKHTVNFMYSTIPNFILGFHGCDEKIAEKILAGRAVLSSSRNKYDWLGHGIYFWENNPKRALEWAREVKNNPELSNHKINAPYVLGAIIDLGHCLNLTESKSFDFLKKGYNSLKSIVGKGEAEMPKNVGKRRMLDCAVINYINELTDSSVEENPQRLDVKKFDSVRGLFIEGDSVYDGSAFKKQTHIQICVRNPNCIKGYFRVLEQDKNFPLP